MTSEAPKYVGKGVYTIRDAIDLTGLTYSKVRHWIRGDKRTGRFGRDESGPIIELQHGLVDRVYLLGFLDLVELLMIKRFHEEGISIQAIRLMHENAKLEFERQDHPFAFQSLYYTAGRDIIMKVADKTGDNILVNLRNRNIELKEITSQFLKNIDFSEGEESISLRWWPIGRDNHVVIDPNRSFGHPVISQNGISTLVLANAVKSEGSIKKAASWYNVDEELVETAYNYERDKTKRIAA